MKVRLDKLLVERGLAASRERAQAMILAGRVLVAEQRVDKAGTPVDEAAALRLLGDDLKFVGRGGLKLERALEYWGIDVTGMPCLDVGTSTVGLRIVCCSGERCGCWEWIRGMGNLRKNCARTRGWS